MNYDVYVDATNMRCPMPILYAKKALSKMQAAQVLRIDTTDAHAIQDIALFAQQTGHTLLQQHTQAESTAHWLRKRAA